MIPRLRIAAELHAAPGWVPLVADRDDKAAYRTDVVMWISPQPNSHEVARRVVDAVNRLGNHSPYFGCRHCEASQIGPDNFKHEFGCLADDSSSPLTSNNSGGE